MVETGRKLDERHSRSSQPENELSTALVSLKEREGERGDREGKREKGRGKNRKKGGERERPGSREFVVEEKKREEKEKRKEGRKTERKKKNVAIFLYRKSFDRDVLEWAS